MAAIGNRLAGAVAAPSAAVSFCYFLTAPYERFTIAASTDVLTAVLLLAVGLAVSQPAARANRPRLATITDADRLARIYRTTQPVRSGAPPGQVVNQVRPNWRRRRPRPSSRRTARCRHRPPLWPQLP
ncbi:DUF4118 domain-containing protein [Dactylosporangium aurantiacum]|uniref:DUF4118 domain-containing protein n=1 Tax=Dactylosporangium aurantiacum TaxID=35754 RepID=A0A9Q9IT65_9ACTN|nr:DUF4118 domain-containing protein [Dactylosporangium aurantiacum]